MHYSFWVCNAKYDIEPCTCGNWTTHPSDKMILDHIWHFVLIRLLVCLSEKCYHYGKSLQKAVTHMLSPDVEN